MAAAGPSTGRPPGSCHVVSLQQPDGSRERSRTGGERWNITAVWRVCEAGDEERIVLDLKTSLTDQLLLINVTPDELKMPD